MVNFFTNKNAAKFEFSIQVLVRIYFIVVPTFDTKVTEYLCSGWVLFLQTNFGFLTRPFLTEFFYIIRKIIFS